MTGRVSSRYYGIGNFVTKWLAEILARGVQSTYDNHNAFTIVDSSNKSFSNPRVQLCISGGLMA